MLDKLTGSAVDAEKPEIESEELTVMENCCVPGRRMMRANAVASTKETDGGEIIGTEEEAFAEEVVEHKNGSERMEVLAEVV